MTTVNKFEHTIFGVLEIIEVEGKAHFPATDVAKKLGYADPHKAISQHTKKGGWANHPVIDSLGRQQQKKFIDEGNLYRLIVNSRLPQAELFEKWVFNEVLPSIRKHGAYMTSDTIDNIISDPDFGIKLLTELKNERDLRVAAQKQIQEEKKYTDFGKVVSLSDGAINVGTFAKLMYDEHGVNIGRNKLMAWLRDNGFLIVQGREKNFPKQQYIERGWFRLATTVVKRSEGDIQSGTTLITGKGQIELAKILLEEFKGGSRSRYA